MLSVNTVNTFRVTSLLSTPGLSKSIQYKSPAINHCEVGNGISILNDHTKDQGCLAPLKLIIFRFCSGVGHI